MTLSELAELAQTATPGLERHNSTILTRGCTACDYLDALSPKRVLAMIAVIEAADAIAVFVDPDFKNVAVFDEARRALDETLK